MKKIKFTHNLVFILFVFSALLLSACGAGTVREPKTDSLTAEETADQLMKSLKDLNLDFFNEHSDNYVSTEKNWLGIPTRIEYRVFRELLQPSPRNKKRYYASYTFAQKLMENLTWRILDVREKGLQTELDMEITNIDMEKATGYYEIYLLEDMISGEEGSFSQFARDIAGLIRSVSSMDGMILAIDQLEEDDVSTITVTLTAYQEDGIWKIHLNDDFINAFMGNINSSDYPLEIKQKIERLTLQYEEKMNRMADQIEEEFDHLTD